jgi:hypothetical protein
VNYKVFHNYHYKNTVLKADLLSFFANHNSDGDLFMVGMAIKGLMFFVAMSIIVRSGSEGSLSSF